MNPPSKSADDHSQTLLGALSSRFARVQILARQLVVGLSTGIHRSPQKGTSATFKQHRAYVPGDEIRRLDWRVFARSDRFYVKEYEQETNLQATLLVDLSGSMEYAGKAATQSKADYARCVAKTLATILIRQQDGVGLVTFDTRVRSFIPARTQPGHIQVLEAALAKEVPANETSIAAVLKQLAPRFGRRSMLILVSDCLEEPSQLIEALARLRHQQHEILIFQILDRDEVDFPFQGWTRFTSLEDTEQQLTADPASLRSLYLENLEGYRAALAEGCKRNRISLLTLMTDEPYESALYAHLKKRLGRG